MTITPRDWVLLVVLALLWSGAFFLTEVLLEEVPPFTLVLGRVSFAALAVLAFVALTGGGMPRDLRIWGAFLIMGALNNAIPFALIVSGQQYIDGGLAATLNSTTPLFSMLLAHFVTRTERITPNRLAGLALGVIGVAVLLGPEISVGFGHAGLGQLAVLGAALSYAFAAIFGRRFRGLRPSATAAGQLTGSTLLILPIALMVDQPWTLTPSATTLTGVLALSLAATAVAYVIYFRVLASAGATNLMLVTLMIPPGAALLGMAFLAQQPTPATWTGMGLILVGLAVIDGRVLSWRSRSAQTARTLT